MLTATRRFSSAADRLWNSSTVAHATRWDLDLPDRDGVFGYMTDVLERQLDRLGGGVEAPARYFYELVDPARGHARRGAGLYAPDARLCAAGRSRPSGDATARAHGPATSRCPADAGGSARRPPTASSSTTRNGRTRSTMAPFRIARAPVTNAEFAAFVEAGGYRRAGILERRRLGLARARRRRTAGLLASRRTAAAGPGGATARSSRWPRMRR